jgi:cob(I)alamin adenosyltransferase
MAITTRKGDSGRTDLLYGPRVRKDHPRIAALGALDELNSWLGLAKARHPRAAVRQLIEDCQRDLILLLSEVAVLPRRRARLKERLGPDRLAHLDAAVARLNAAVKPTPHFVLPGANELSATLHVARCVARRAERDLLPCAPGALARAYINRLSDLLYLLARAAGK